MQLKFMLSNKKPTPTAQSKKTTPQVVDLTADASQPDQAISENLGGRYGLSFRFRGILRSLCDSGKWEEINNRSICHKCGQPPQDPHVTACLHIYCKECLLSMTYEAASQDKEKATCLECNAQFSGSEPCQGFEQAAFSPESGTSNRPNRENRGNPQSSDEDVDWLSLTSFCLPSAKTLGIKAQCLKWQEENPNAKIVIFTQFRGMIKVKVLQNLSGIQGLLT